MRKKGGIEEGKIEVRKEPIHQQGYNWKNLVIHCIIVESEFIAIKLMELKFLNGTHTKLFFKNEH